MSYLPRESCLTRTGVPSASFLHPTPLPALKLRNLKMADVLPSSAPLYGQEYPPSPLATLPHQLVSSSTTPKWPTGYLPPLPYTDRGLPHSALPSLPHHLLSNFAPLKWPMCHLPQESSLHGQWVPSVSPPHPT